MADDNNDASQALIEPNMLGAGAGAQDKQQVRIRKLGQVLNILVERGLVSQEQIDAIREEVGL